MSLTKTAVALLLAGSAILIAPPFARAQSAADAYEAAAEECANAMKGQRSFCMIQAQDQYNAATAKEQNKDVVVHHDYDTSNDTPAQTEAKQTYNQAAENCADMMKGQRSLCMIEANEKYNQGMGW